jgi:hypothetical protein
VASSVVLERNRERALTHVAQRRAGPRKRTVETCDDRTAQERQIARLAVMGGRTRRSERGSSSARAPWSTRNVFTKLAIRSRHELSSALPSSGSDLAPA